MDIKISERYEPLFGLLNGDYPEVDVIAITGGRNSQKSFATALFACIGAKDYGYNILYTRYTLTSAQDSIIPDFNEKLDLLNCYKEFDVTKDRIIGANSKIVFKGIKTSAGNQTASLKSLKGFNCWIYDEAEEHPDFESWDKIQKSIRSNTHRNLSIILLNPATKAHWLYGHFFEDRGVTEGFNGVHKNVMYIHTTYQDLEREIIADNIWNDFEEKRIAHEQWNKLNDSDKEISPLKKKALYFKHTILGGWLNKAEGVVFENWRVGEFIDTGYSMFGADFGFSNDPSTLVYTSVDRKNKKIYIKELLYRPKMSTTELYEHFSQHCRSRRIIADSAEPRLIDELKDRGLNIIGAVKGQGSITAGIAKLLDYELIIEPNSKNLVTELNNYVWNDKTTKDVPIDKYNHCFIGSTLITTSKGLKPIKDIEVGDLVLTRKGYKKVLKKFNNGVKKVNKYSMQSDTFSVYLCSTKEHKILSKTWKEISKLQSGEMVYQHKPSTNLFLDTCNEEQKEFIYNTAITTSRLKHFEIGESWNEEVYDIMVDECHEYFANGILVHNCIDSLRYSVSELIEPQKKFKGGFASLYGL